MFFKRFFALFTNRNKEFLRDRSAFGWNIFMPVLIIVGFAFAFSDEATNQYKVGVINKDQATKSAQQFLGLKHLDFYNVEESATEETLTRLQRHQVDMLLDAKKQAYWINSESPSGYLVEKILHSIDRDSFTRQEVKGKKIRYLDWVMPGILSMNMMFSALFGVGFVIVRYRKNGMLRRLKATPVTALEYLTAQVVSRLLLIIFVTAVVLYGTSIFVDFVMNGSHLLLFLVFTLGALSMISMSLIVAARISNEETAGGILNLLSWPMMFFSGVWFSMEGAAPWMRSFAELFPLTHLTSAARVIMIDGAGITDISYQLTILVAQTVIFMLIGSKLFKWE